MLEIAKILKPQGIKGEVKALPSTNVVEIFSSLKECLVGNRTMQIEHISFRQGFLYIKFKGVNTRNDAELERGKTIKVERSILESAKADDEFLVDELIGMVVYDDQGELVGQIIKVMNYGATDILVFEKEHRQMQAPYIKEVFYKQGDFLVAKHEKLVEVLV